MGKVPAVIDVGTIALGPELQRLPILGELTRLARAVSGPHAALFEIAFVIPGSLGRAEFDQDYDVVERGGRRRRVQVFVVVPDQVVTSSDPMPALIDLAHSAVEHARGSGARPIGGEALDYDALRATLSAAEVALGRPPASREPRAPTSQPVPPIEPRAERPQACVVIGLQVGEDGQAIAAAGDLEAYLEGQLGATGTGYVDGNEIGNGVVEIYVYGPSYPELRDVVVDAVRSRWKHGATTLRILLGEDEVDRFTLDSP